MKVLVDERLLKEVCKELPLNLPIDDESRAERVSYLLKGLNEAMKDAEMARMEKKINELQNLCHRFASALSSVLQVYVKPNNETTASYVAQKVLGEYRREGGHI